jgi:hypothetical protein
VRLLLGRLGAPPARSTADLDPVDAVRTLLAEPDTTSMPVLDDAPTWMLAQAGSAARAHLAMLLDEGSEDAARAVAWTDPDRIIAAERSVLTDPATHADRRRLAAFRLLDQGVPIEDATLLNLLDEGPADGDGTVHAAALLAGRGMSDEARTRLLRRWLDSDENDQRRAGVMLAAVLHATGRAGLGPAEIAAIDRLGVEQTVDPRVRRTARLATRVLDRWPHDDVDADAYAARTTRLDDGRLDADTVLLGILARDPDASRRLTASPRMAPLPDPERAAAFARDVAWRRAIVSSITPDRFRAVGEPIPGDEDDLRLWIEVLAADRLVAGPFQSDPDSIAESPALDETPQP